MPQQPLPEWEQLLDAAARLQGILPDVTLVGGTAAALDADHRRSIDADHVMVGLIDRFDEVLAELESVVGWKTARVKRPVAIYGSLDGILTTVRNQIRAAPLETVEIEVAGRKLRVPTRKEILRIKAWLVVTRNATRDYLDVAAIAAKLGDADLLAALASLDHLYAQPGDPGAVRQQVMRQLASPKPFDLDQVKLDEYKGLVPQWRNWATVLAECRRVASLMAAAVANRRTGWTDLRA